MGRKPQPRAAVVQPQDESIRYIALTQNKVAVVDAHRYEELVRRNWYAAKVKTQTGFYAARDVVVDGKKRTIFMHNEIYGPVPGGLKLDHEDGNGLHNWTTNLRPSNHAQNHWNMGKARTNTSGFKGVFWQPQMSRWFSQIKVNNKLIYLGCFLPDEKEKAARVYDAAAIKYHGEFACLNFPR